MPKNLTGNSVFIYDTDGNMVTQTKIWEHDANKDVLEISDLPEVEEDSHYDLLIPAEPVPYTCKGKVTKRGSFKYIYLFRIKETENRRDFRYTVDFPAEIEYMICDDTAYAMHKPVEVKLKNLSKNGLRFKTKYNALMTGDCISLRLRLNDEKEKLLTAHVVYRSDENKESSEYGCRLLSRRDN